MVSIKTMNFDHLMGRDVGTARLLRQLDNGSMAVLFVAFQKTLKRQIAVKIVPKILLTPKLTDMFHHEAEAAAFLSHPCIIPVYEIGETEEFLFFTMQLVQGKSLAQYIREARKNPIPSKRTLSIRTTLKIIVKVLDGLNYANSMGIVHRDVKPSNILIEDHSHRPIITDFGVARSYAGSDQDARILVGTPTYMAPEQIVSAIVDGQADVYATGVMLFEMLCGRLPYPVYDSPTQLLKTKLRLKEGLFTQTPSQINPKVDPALEGIVLKAVAYPKKERFADCRQFAQAIDTYLSTTA